MSQSISRRTFLKMLATGAGALAIGGLGFNAVTKSRTIPGKLLGPSAALGHAIRDRRPFPAPSATEEVDILIVGGGIAGLSTGWWLQKHGLTTFRLLDMENHIGGNSTSGKNAISAYPWAAHYVPLPGEDAHHVRELFEELGIITGYDSKKHAIYEPLYLCHDPDERLFKDGEWQDGLVPVRGATEDDKRQLKAFFEKIQAFKKARGKDGKRAFTIPLDLSSSDERFRKLDAVSMHDWLQREGLTSRLLQWYVNYCCRDDYGSTAERVSAWAGIHYFAARDAEPANAEPGAVVTWPEGNGWLVKRLQEKLAGSITLGQMAFHIESQGGKVHVDVLDSKSGQTTRYIANDVVFAGPRFIGSRIIPELNQESLTDVLEYAPWMVANVSVRHAPAGEGVALAWDNVSYHNDSLGYVVATHQEITRYPGKTVLTYYRPLSDASPKEARQAAYRKTHGEWTRQIVHDLNSMHPGIEHEIENIDVWVWGHGMINPKPGFIWGETRKALGKPLGRIRFAHSDMSGISIFEEAQYQGVKAAKDILNSRGIAS